MSDKLAIVILSSLMLILCACESNEPSMDYATGTEGITVEFDSIPQKVYELTPLIITAEVQNKGVFDNDPYSLGYVYLHGFDKSAMPFLNIEGDNNYARLDLPAVQKKSAYMEEGGYDTVQFEIPEGALIVPSGTEYVPTLMLSTVYRYKTVATPTVCILPDPLDDKICKPRTIYMTSQGAPVAVTKLEQEPMRAAVAFVATIENLGGGNVVGSEYLDVPPFSLKKNEMLDKVTVKMSMSNTNPAVCQPSNTIKLYEGKGTIYCRFDLMQTEAYTTPLLIELEYAYSSNVEKQISIVKIPGSGSNYMGNMGSSSTTGTSGTTTGSTTGTTASSSSGTVGTTTSQTGTVSSGTATSGTVAEPQYIVYLYVDGQMKLCQVDDISVRRGQPVSLRVAATNNLVNCRLRAGANNLYGTCGGSDVTLSYTFNSAETVSVMGYDSSGTMRASQLCPVRVYE